MSLTLANQKDIYLIYAINRRTRSVIDFFIGNRTKENIKKVVDTVLFYNPKKIYTDGLNCYPSLIHKTIHRPGRRLTNRIERKNLTFRNAVKRLTRYTLCFSRNRNAQCCNEISLLELSEKQSGIAKEFYIFI